MITCLGKFLFRRQLNSTMRLMPSAFSSNRKESEIPLEVLKARERDLPVEMENPYAKPRPQCILCKYKIIVNYKNVRLLSQFVSSFSGRVYGRHVTGLCERQQTIVEKAIKMSQHSGLMPYYFKNVNYIRDPELFNPNKPIRSHRF